MKPGPVRGCFIAICVAVGYHGASASMGTSMSMDDWSYSKPKLRSGKSGKTEGSPISQSQQPPKISASVLTNLAMGTSVKPYANPVVNQPGNPIVNPSVKPFANPIVNPSVKPFANPIVNTSVKPPASSFKPPLNKSDSIQLNYKPSNTSSQLHPVSASNPAGYPPPTVPSVPVTPPVQAGPQGQAYYAPQTQNAVSPCQVAAQELWRQYYMGLNVQPQAQSPCPQQSQQLLWQQWWQQYYARMGNPSSGCPYQQQQGQQYQQYMQWYQQQMQRQQYPQPQQYPAQPQQVQVQQSAHPGAIAQSNLGMTTANNQATAFSIR